MKYTNKTGLPEALASAIANDDYNAGDSDITVTGLIAPPRQRALMKAHADEMIEDVSENIWRLLGKAVHSILEKADNTGITEERLFISRHGWAISGAFDRLCLLSGVLQDYKVTSAWSVKDGPKDEWEAQLNLLALLCREHGRQINGLQIVAILRDHSRREAQRSSDYPQSQVAVFDIPLWSEERAEEYLFERVRLHQIARDGNLPECSDSDRWKTSDTWAVMKQGAKRAKKVCKNEQEAGSMAADLGDGFYVEFRRGEAKRCESYCSAAPWCEQYQKEKEADNV